MATQTPPYPNDPLRWVAADIRFPPLEALSTEIPTGIRDHFRTRFPVLEPVAQLAISFPTPGQAPQMPQQATLHRMFQRDRLTAITLGRDGLTVETTDYPGWTQFGDLLVEVIEVLSTTCRPDGVLRVGLRYVDEIRLPTPPNGIGGWTQWIDPKLLAPLSLDEKDPVDATVSLQYGKPPGFVTVFRASPKESGHTVNPDGPMRQPLDFPDGPYFMLDTDSSWADPRRQVPDFSQDVILPVFEQLHAHGHDLFEASITPDLRLELAKERSVAWGTE